MSDQEITFSENLDELMKRFSTANDCSLIVYCTNGSMQLEIDEQQHIIVPHDLFLCTPELIIGNSVHSPDFTCKIIVIRKHALDDIFYLCTRGDTKWWEKTKYLHQNPVIHLNERQQELGKLFNCLFILYRDDERSELSEKIRRIFVQAAIYELLGWLEESLIQTSEAERKHGRQEVLFRDFMKLLQETKGRHREVRWYANQLSVTPKYLSVVCHANTGKTAQLLIIESTVQEIKHLLRHTDMSVKEIRAQVNFVSLSFFCKFVKQHLGMTAHQYRNAVSRRH